MTPLRHEFGHEPPEDNAGDVSPCGRRAEMGTPMLREVGEVIERSAGHPLVRSVKRCAAAVLAISLAMSAGTAVASPVGADSTGDLAAAVLSARGNGCPPLQPDPLVQQTSDMVLRSTDTYLDHTARAIPIADPLPTLHDLGSTNTGKAVLFQGAGRNPTDAIKFVLITGRDAIPDCSYTRYGVSAAQNATSGFFLTTLVLAGV